MMLTIWGIEFKITYNEELGVNQAYVVGGGDDCMLDVVVDQVERDFGVVVIF